MGSIILSSCGLIDIATENISSVVGLNETGTVISKSANIRSSYALVAADLLEVKRGQQVEVLEIEKNDEDVTWYRVRANDEEATEGWIESQHVIIEESLDKSRKLAEEAKDLQPQATGQLRAASNLRLNPGVTEENILLRLDNGAAFEIVDWEFIVKSKDSEEKDEPENEEIKAAKEGKEKEPDKLDDRYDIWYKVRLDPSVSPAPMGWVYGRQVELQVPSDIVYYQENDRKFITWQRLDDAGVNTEISKDSGAKVSIPGSWVVLSRTDEVKAIDGVEPDFDGILVLGFDKYRQEHYTAYSTYREKINIWGQLPLRVEGSGDNKTFTLKIRNEQTGKLEDKRFVIFKDKNNRFRVTPPEDLKKATAKK